jgi:hypothetical protein
MTLQPWIAVGARDTEEALKKELFAIKSLLMPIKEKSTETWRG